MSTVETITQVTESIPAALSLRPSAKSPENNAQEAQRTSQKEPYRYAHLLPAFPKDEHYPPLTPFEHVDPAARALNLTNPRAFLDNATSIVELTPNLGTEVQGVNLATLDSDGRDQLALLVCTILILTHLVVIVSNILGI